MQYNMHIEYMKQLRLAKKLSHLEVTWPIAVKK